MFDETTDISNISQLALILRYTDGERIFESFLKFIDVRAEDHHDGNDNTEPIISGFKIGRIVIEELQKNFNLDLKKCVGITTDGCSAMVSEVCGAVKTVQEEAINAVFSPCSNHGLNLSISQTSKVKSIRNAVDTMTETISFLGASSKRSVPIKKILGHKLSGLCETRWIERHDGVLQFRESLPLIIKALESMCSWKDPQTRVKARGLKTSLLDAETVVAIVCLSDILTCTQQASYFFQKIQVDLKSAQDMTRDTLTKLIRRREKCTDVFATIFEEIRRLADDLDIEIKVPRTAAIQKHRENYPSQDPLTYFRQSIYIPVLENVIEDIKTRFPEETLNMFGLLILFPKLKETDHYKEKINYIAEKYSSFFNKSKGLVAKELASELESWSLKWEKEPNIGPRSALDLLNKCDKDIYPIIQILLRILITLPISNASAERTFSTLRRLKSWLRNTMSEDRLNGLALLNIYYDLEVDPEDIINRYAKKRNHRIEFVI